MTRKTKRLFGTDENWGWGEPQSDKEEYCGDKNNNRLLQKENTTIRE